MDKTIECTIRLVRLFFPKNTTKANDCWISALAKVVKIQDSSNSPVAIGDTIKIAGEIEELEFGVDYMLIATLKEDERYGRQYKILALQSVTARKEATILTDPIEQRLFLEMVLTDHQVNSLYQTIENPFVAISKGDINALTSVKGIGEATAKQIIQKYKANANHALVYALVSDFGGTKKQADKLIEAFRYKGGDLKLVDTINENPYILIAIVDGIGWKTADNIALSRGLAKDSIGRITSFIVYHLQNIGLQGQSWIDMVDLFGVCLTELELADDVNFKLAIKQLLKDKVIGCSQDKSKVYWTVLYNLEQDIANELMRIQSAKKDYHIDDIDEQLLPLEKEQGWSFTDEQKQAIKKILQNQAVVITGYGGTGKSSIVAGALHLSKGMSFAQCALSGRAASRLSEVTKEEGHTIHRLLGYNPMTDEFMFNKENPLPYDIIILDEVSMVGGSLFRDLLQAIPTGTQLIMIGDDGQLESIGSCNIFKDMLDSGVIPVARLARIHRQAAKSAIVTESIKVREHKQLVPNRWTGEETRGENQDLKLKVYDSKDLTQQYIIEEYKKIYDKIHNPRRIQVVVPQRVKGEISTYALNLIIQDYVNPPKGEDKGIKVSLNGSRKHKYYLRVGDKVIVNSNNYEAKTIDKKKCPIFNGNQGVVTCVDLDTGSIVVDFDQWGEIIIGKYELSTIELAYALTCHKLQGSEADYVIVGLDFSAYIMLTKEWLYTAITRAKQKCCVCAEGQALRHCISNSNISTKRTFLKDFLIDRAKMQND